MLITTALLGIVIGAVIMLLTDVNKGHIHQQNVAEIQGNERYAMDTLLRAIRGAGNNPAGLVFDQFDLDPDGNGQFDSLRIRSDFNPPDADISDPDEVVLFSVSGNVLQITDESTRTTSDLAQNISGMTFQFLDATGAVTADPSLIRTVEVTLSGISSRRDPRTKAFATINLTDRTTVRASL